MLKIWRMWNVGAMSSILITSYDLKHLLKGQQVSINIWSVAKNLRLDGAP
jgi:hypothetical protein